MKAKKLWFAATGFFTGLFAGLSILAFWAFTGSPSGAAGGSEMVPVPAATANQYLKNYLAGAVPLNAALKGFSIDRNQVAAMDALLKENAALAGFRIYLGKNGEGKPVAIVVGLDALGNDAVKNTIYSTEAPKTGPCPPVCDVASPIGTVK